MKATLTIIRGGPSAPSSMLAFEGTLSEGQINAITQNFDQWWNTGGVFVVQGVALSVVDINLDINSSGVTIIPRP